MRSIMSAAVAVEMKESHSSFQHIDPIVYQLLFNYSTIYA